MNKKVRDELVDSTLAQLKAKEINVATAAMILGVSERQIYKIKKRALNPKKQLSKTKPPSNKTDQTIIDKIVALYKTTYRKFSYVHFNEKLACVEHININLKTLRRILMKENLISPFANKKTKENTKKILQSINDEANHVTEQNPFINDNIILDGHSIHNRFKRIQDFGALIQMDARKDFYIDKEKWTLHLAIDVASGAFVGAYFDKEETLLGYQHVLHQIITNYGIPRCILTDNRTVFEYLKKGSNTESKNTLIQFKYSCIRFGIKLNTTSVPTYKSIIERGNGTFGRRLPQELSINGITDIDIANMFLGKYLVEINVKFAHVYAGKNVMKKSPNLQTINNIIGTITRRVFDKACCVRFQNNYYYATINDKIVTFINGTKALIVKTFDNRIIIVVNSIAYNAVNINDYEYSYEKQLNPEGELFIEKHRATQSEIFFYSKKHISNWNFDSFEKYVEEELRFIDKNY